MQQSDTVEHTANVYGQEARLSHHQTDQRAGPHVLAESTMVMLASSQVITLMDTNLYHSSTLCVTAVLNPRWCGVITPRMLFYSLQAQTLPKKVSRHTGAGLCRTSSSWQNSTRSVSLLLR